MWMIVFLVLPILGLAYAGWHTWQVLPFATAWRWVIVGVMLTAFLTIFLNFSRTIDNIPLRLATIVYEVGNSAIFVLLYLVMTFIVLDILGQRTGAVGKKEKNINQSTVKLLPLQYETRKTA